MPLRYSRFASEFFFVISMLILIKFWIFPFLISIWFPTNDHSSHLLEWVDVMIGLFSCFIYIGLGSIAKYVYRLSIKEAGLLYLCFHLPLFIPRFPFLFHWEEMLTNALELFYPSFSIHTWQLFFLYYFLFSLGRVLQVVEKKRDIPQENRINQGG